MSQKFAFIKSLFAPLVAFFRLLGTYLSQFRQWVKSQKLGLRIYINFAILVFLVFGYFLAVDLNLFWLFGASPSLEDLQRPKLAQASEVYTADNVLVGKYFSENRSTVEYHKISPFLVKALVCTEDIRFYEHQGIDPAAMMSILFYAAKGDNRGGSTLTQQLAKNLYKTRKKDRKGLLGYVPGLSLLIQKSKEWMTAVKLEQSYTKQEILTMYLNTVDFGRNSYGIKTAAKTFFSTSPDSLNIQESALLVGMLKATTAYNPKKNYKRALDRRNTVLQQMVKYNQLSARAYDSLSKLPITLRIKEEDHKDGPEDYYNYELTRALTAWGDTNDIDINSDGLKIYLHIDSRMQEYARQSVKEHMKELQRRFDNHWGKKNPWCDEKGNEIPYFIETLVKRTPSYKSLKQQFGDDTIKIWQALNTPKPMVLFNWNKPDGDSVVMSTMDSLRYVKRLLHGSILAVDPYSGGVKAWIGNLDWRFFKYDHVKQSRRQPGSTFKAMVYAAAMDSGFSPCYRIKDQYVSIDYVEDSAGFVLNKNWKPRNATGYFSGVNMTLRHGIGRSVNSIAAQLCMKLGPEKVALMAKKLGIKSPMKPLPAIALGSYDVNLYEMVGAYATFVNYGVFQAPMLVKRIEDRNGRLIHEFKPEGRQAISEKAAWLMVHMLKGTLQEPMGTAQALFSFRICSGNDVAGKTGTSQNQSDGWFVGFTKDIVAGVWTGADERSVHFRSLRMGEGSKTALPIFGKFMEKVYEDKSLGYRFGYFPKPKVPINVDLYCPTAYPRKDTARKDSSSLRVDSAGAFSPVGTPDESVIQAP